MCIRDRDRFAKESVVLTSAMSNCPLSSPHRGILLTGMYPEHYIASAFQHSRQTEQLHLTLSRQPELQMVAPRRADRQQEGPQPPSLDMPAVPPDAIGIVLHPEIDRGTLRQLLSLIHISHLLGIGVEAGRAERHDGNGDRVCPRLRAERCV